MACRCRAQLAASWMGNVQHTDIALRAADPDDERRILEWRNDPWIVSLSAGQKTIDPREHRAWFASVLEDNDCLLYIVEDKSGQGMGTVRVEKADVKRALLTIYLLREFTGSGRGVSAITQATSNALDAWPGVSSVHAIIRPENLQSDSAFLKAGYAVCDAEERLEQASGFNEMRFVR